jgi:transcriptional regulator with XRE-family HTH domain
MAPYALPRGRHTLADRLNRLFDMVRPRGEDRQYTNIEVAAATNVSGTYIGYLRRGVRDNPSVDTVQALARFFGVRPSYLVDDDLDHDKVASTEAQVRLFQVLDDPGIRQLALRAAAAELSPTGLDAIAAMIDQVKKLEQQAAPAPVGTTGRRRGPKQTDPPEAPGS